MSSIAPAILEFVKILSDYPDKVRVQVSADGKTFEVFVDERELEAMTARAPAIRAVCQDRGLTKDRVLKFSAST